MYEIYLEQFEEAGKIQKNGYRKWSPILSKNRKLKLYIVREVLNG